MLVEFIRTHQGRREAVGLVWGVEPICTVLTEHGLPIAPSTSYDHLERIEQGPSRRQRQLATLSAGQPAVVTDAGIAFSLLHPCPDRGLGQIEVTGHLTDRTVATLAQLDNRPSTHR